MQPLPKVFKRLVGPSLTISFDVDTLRLKLGDKSVAISRGEAEELVEALQTDDIYVPLRIIRGRRPEAWLTDPRPKGAEL